MLHTFYFNRDIVAVRAQRGLPDELVRVLELHWSGELLAACELANKLLAQWEGTPPPLLVAEHALMTVKLGRSLPDVKRSMLGRHWLSWVVHEYARFLSVRVNQDAALVSLVRLFVLGLRAPTSGLLGLAVFGFTHLLAVRGWVRIGFPVARFFFRRTAQRVASRGKTRFSDNFVLATFLYTVLAAARLRMLDSVTLETQSLLPRDPFYQTMFLVCSLYTAAYSGNQARTEVVSAQFLAHAEAKLLYRYQPLAEILPLLPMALRGYGHLVDGALSTVVARHEAREVDVGHAVHNPFFRTAALISLSAGRFGNAKIYITRAIRHRRLTKSFHRWERLDQRILDMAEGHETFTPDTAHFFGIQLETTVPTSLGKLLCDIVSATPASLPGGVKAFEERVFALLRRHLDCPFAEIRTSPASFSETVPQIRVGKRFVVAYGLGRKRARTVDRIFAAVAPVLAILEHNIEQMLSVEARTDGDTHAGTIHRTTQMLAHDVRRPFQLLRIGLESLAAVRTQGEALEVVRTLLPEVQRASQDVDHLIEDTMRMSHGPKPVPTPVDELVTGSLRDVFAVRMDCEIELRYDGVEDGVHLAVDPVRMRRALSNVIGNAVEAMRGAGIIWFALTPAGDDGFHELRIGNSGPPLDEEQLARIFDAFYSSGKPGGTGLGLAIAHRVVVAHGGTIGCANVAHGVEFRLTLPAAQPRHRAMRPGRMPSHCHELTVAAAAPGPTRKAPPREIAVVDDSRAIHLAWRTGIGGHAEVHYFRSPAAFWEAIDGEPGLLERLYAVITDFRFSDREDCGSKLAERLRLRRPDLPILVSSSGILEDVDVDGIFDAVLEKGGLSWPRLERIVAGVRATWVEHSGEHPRVPNGKAGDGLRITSN
ncbi:ATP-binding protein [Pendulispora rubella]|uniref:histidine kinase n=1 Tax=Pendulispora rubella TaxID=2741070 RepID=A0ABZ2L9P6_9BACT